MTKHVFIITGAHVHEEYRELSRTCRCRAEHFNPNQINSHIRLEIVGFPLQNVPENFYNRRYF